MSWEFSFINKPRNLNLPTSLLLFLMAFIFSSCAGLDQTVKDMKDYLPDIEIEDFTTGVDISDKREELTKTITPLKNTKIIFSNIISLKDLNKGGLQKNRYFLAGEIYSKNHEEPISSLSGNNCYSPQGQGSTKKLERLYHVFIKDLGLDSANLNELDGNENLDSHILVQPVLLKYQYCKRADVEIRYIIQNNVGGQTSKTIKTSHKTKNFKFPEKEESYPFFNYNDPEAQFPELRHALTMAFHKNTLGLIEMMAEADKNHEAK